MRDSASKRLMTAVDGPPSLAVVAPVDRRKPRDSKETRIAAWKEFILGGAFDVFYEAIDYLSHHFGRITRGEVSPETEAAKALISDEDAVELMRETIAMQTTTEALEARRQQIRGMVFDHITATYVREDADDPRNISGVLPVPDLGKKFCKEGAGITDSMVDWQHIEKHLSEEEWAEVTDREVIPEQVVVSPNQGKLADFIEAHPEKAAMVRRAMIPGVPKTPRYQIRDLDEDPEYD